MEGLEFHESYGHVRSDVLSAMRHYNVTQSDWDDMLNRWGLSWDTPDLPWDGILNHIVTHSAKGYYSWPMYG